MAQPEKKIDGFRFLPPSLKAWIGSQIPQVYSGDIPWTPISKPVNQATFSIVTSAGINLKTDPPFNMEREKQEPTWGDPTYRVIPKESTEQDIDVSHLHINTDFILQDINVMLPLARMKELEQDRVIGKMAPTAYSFYGFQWERTSFLTEAIEPMSKQMKEEGVDYVILTPA
jgi:D-proline reductase (dithiol) PrdB